MPRTKKTLLKATDEQSGDAPALVELRELVELITDFDHEYEVVRALLKIVNEFKFRKNKPVQIEDLCDTLYILIYQTTRECEKKAFTFAELVGGVA